MTKPSYTKRLKKLPKRVIILSKNEALYTIKSKPFQLTNIHSSFLISGWTSIVQKLRMKSMIVLSLYAVLAVAAAGLAGQYTDRYDNINIDEILGNRRLLIPYVHCLLDKGKCTPEGKELKSHIREALENDCAQCTPPQRTRSRQVIGHLINHEPTYWNELCQKYDPTQKYTRKYEQELRTIAA